MAISGPGDQAAQQQAERCDVPARDQQHEPPRDLQPAETSRSPATVASAASGSAAAEQREPGPVQRAVTGTGAIAAGHATSAGSTSSPAGGFQTTSSSDHRRPSAPKTPAATEIRDGRERPGDVAGQPRAGDRDRGDQDQRAARRPAPTPQAVGGAAPPANGAGTAGPIAPTRPSADDQQPGDQRPDRAAGGPGRARRQRVPVADAGSAARSARRRAPGSDDRQDQDPHRPRGHHLAGDDEARTAAVRPSPVGASSARRLRSAARP